MMKANWTKCQTTLLLSFLHLLYDQESQTLLFSVQKAQLLEEMNILQMYVFKSPMCLTCLDRQEPVTSHQSTATYLRHLKWSCLRQDILPIHQYIKGNLWHKEIQS